MTYNGESLSSREISWHKLASLRFAEKYRFWDYVSDEFWWRVTVVHGLGWDNLPTKTPFSFVIAKMDDIKLLDKMLIDFEEEFIGNTLIFQQNNAAIHQLDSCYLRKWNFSIGLQLVPI